VAARIRGPRLAALTAELEAAVVDHRLDPFAAADRLLEAMDGQER
jgi:hypothetical protein